MLPRRSGTQSQASDRVNTPGQKRCCIVLQGQRRDGRRPRHLVPSESSVCGPLNSLAPMTTEAPGPDAAPPVGSLRASQQGGVAF